MIRVMPRACVAKFNDDIQRGTMLENKSLIIDHKWSNFSKMIVIVIG